MSKRSIYQFGKDAIEDAIASIVGARKQITKNQIREPQFLSIRHSIFQDFMDM